jgi:hypothetical protein
VENRQIALFKKYFRNFILHLIDKWDIKWAITSLDGNLVRLSDGSISSSEPETEYLLLKLKYNILEIITSTSITIVNKLITLINNDNWTSDVYKKYHTWILQNIINEPNDIERNIERISVIISYYKWEKSEKLEVYNLAEQLQNILHSVKSSYNPEQPKN